MPLLLPIALDATFIIPFMFTLAVVFGVLELALGRTVMKNRAVLAIISLAIAFFAASYSPFVSALNAYLPSVTWFFIVMFFIAFVFELFGLRKPSGREERGKSLAVLGVLLLLLFAIGLSVLQAFPVEMPLIGGGENIILLVGLVFIIAIFWTALSMKEEQPKQGGQQ